MLELIKAGGLIIWPILVCSAVSLAIVAERFWALQKNRIAPKNLTTKIQHWKKNGALDIRRIQELKDGSPLGYMLATGLVNRTHDRAVIKERIEEVGRHIVHEMERFLNTLGTIAAITPLLGLLGTVVGMIKVFAVITTQGVGDPSILAEGISEALLTTAAGLSVAIPSLILHRYFHGHIDNLVITMEQEALQMIEALTHDQNNGSNPLV